MKESKIIEISGRYGATLSLIEVGLGSFLHALHVPFSGALLSLNQGYLLCRAALESRSIEKNKWMTYGISNIAAVLKSLSPAGKKLGPMLSLSMQGLLFNVGTITLGNNLVGLCVGMSLLAIWTFIQPLLTYYLFFGDQLFSAAEYLYQKTLPYHQIKKENLIWFFLLLVLAKMLMACALAIVAWRRQNKSLYSNTFENQLIAIARKKMNDEEVNRKPLHPSVLAFKDLFRPLFLVSLTMTLLFLIFSNTKNSQIIWYLMRPIAIGFIFFYISRTLTLDRWLKKVEEGNLRSFSLSCQTALTKIRNKVN